MSKLGPGLLRILAAMVVPVLAAAQTAITTKDVHLRAGPAREYPVVAVLAAGTEVAVQGCLSDYSWCDVIAGVERGWVWSRNLDYREQRAYVPFLPLAPQIGIAIVPFSFFDYWSDHYRDRPWYRDRDRWAHPPRRTLPPPRPAPGPRPPPAVRPVPEPRPTPLPAPAPRPAPGVRLPPDAQLHPGSGHPAPPRQTDRRRPSPPPPGMARQAPPGRTGGGEERR